MSTLDEAFETGNDEGPLLRIEADQVLVCEAIEAVGQMLSNVLHDVNNGLGSALMATQVAQRLRPVDESRIGKLLSICEHSIREVATPLRKLNLLRENQHHSFLPHDLRDVVDAAVCLATHGSKCCECDLSTEHLSQPILVRCSPTCLAVAVAHQLQTLLINCPPAIHLRTTTTDSNAILDVTIQSSTYPPHTRDYGRQRWADEVFTLHAVNVVETSDSTLRIELPKRSIAS